MSRHDDGLTLVELLVTVVILGVLAAVALPTYLGQRDRANQASVTQDMRNTAVAIEGWAAGTGHELTELDGTTETSPQLQREGLRLGDWTTLAVRATRTTYCVHGLHRQLPDRELRYDSATGRVELGPLGTLSC